jgi:hypothetical protein
LRSPPWFRIGLVVLIFLAGCKSGFIPGEGKERNSPSDDSKVQSLSVTPQELAFKNLEMIRDGALEYNLNAFLIAGIGLAETFLIHCLKDWDDLNLGVKYPILFDEPKLSSESCGLGSVLTGQGDGSAEQGGVGLFQFDNGTYANTINHYRENYDLNILKLEENVAAVAKFFIHEKGWSQFEEYSNSLGTNIDAAAFNPEFIQNLTGYYNGCWAGQCSHYDQRFKKYLRAYRDLKLCIADDFWSTPGAKASYLPTCPYGGQSIVAAADPKNCNRGYCVAANGKELAGEFGKYLSDHYCDNGNIVPCVLGCYGEKSGNIDVCVSSKQKFPAAAFGGPHLPSEAARAPASSPIAPKCSSELMNAAKRCEEIAAVTAGGSYNTCHKTDKKYLVICSDKNPRWVLCERGCVDPKTNDGFYHDICKDELQQACEN